MSEQGNRPPDAAASYPYNAGPAPEAFPAAEARQGRRPWWKGPAGGFAAALLLGAVAVGGYFGVNAFLEDKLFTLTGTLQLNTDSLTTSGLPIGYNCAGTAAYNDIGPSTPVTVNDETGKLLAKGGIESSYGQPGSCTLSFKVFDVPSGAKFYKVEVSHRGEMSYTEVEAKTGIQVSLGSAEPRPSAAPAPAPAARPSPGPAPARPARPVPADRPESVPAYSTPCAPTFFDRQFSTAAVGSSVTSCAFAEEVRGEYVNQPRRAVPVTLAAYSSVTGRTYTMTCSGSSVVTCTGGDNAVVFLY